VIVIGAGMAGVSAARNLQDANVPVIILEARNRYGGRVFTDRTSIGVPAEIGAAWIHGPVGNPLTPLQQKFNMRTAVTNNNALIRYKSDGTEFTDAEYSSSESSFNSLVRRTSNYAITKRDRGDADSSLDSLMQVVDPTSYASENIQWHIGTNTEFDYGAPATQLSGYYYQSDSAFSGNDVVMPDGYDKMIHGLLTNPTSINVQYNTVVTSIDYSQDVINVTTSSGTVYRASKVICTVPLGVLKAGDVKFTPPLPANKQASIDRLRMGSTNKVFAIFPSVFWDNTQTYFGIHTGTTAATRGRFSYWLNAKPLTPNGENLLMYVSLIVILIRQWICFGTIRK
jgi:monoamine oxidase